MPLLFVKMKPMSLRLPKGFLSFSYTLNWSGSKLKLDNVPLHSRLPRVEGTSLQVLLLTLSSMLTQAYLPSRAAFPIRFPGSVASHRTQIKLLVNKLIHSMTNMPARINN